MQPNFERVNTASCVLDDGNSTTSAHTSPGLSQASSIESSTVSSPNKTSTAIKSSPTSNAGLCKKVSGIICLSIVIADWILMSVIAGNFSHPLFTRYIVQSSYLVALIPYFIYRYVNGSTPNQKQEQSDASEQVALATDSQSDHSKVKVTSGSNSNVIEKGKEEEKQKERETDLFGIFKWSLILVVLSLFSGYTWYLSLAKTNFAVNNTIYQSQCVVVYILSAIFLSTPVTWQKSIAVLLCSGGVGLLSFSSSQAPNSGNSPFGLAMCMLSMFMYAIIGLICGHINKYFFNPRHIVRDSMLFQGVSGMMSLFVLWIIILIWHFVGLETFEWPSQKVWQSILTLAGLNCLFFFVFLVGTVCTSPVFMATGSVILVPVSFIVDVIASQQSPNAGSIVGATIICVGFLLMELPIFQYIRAFFKVHKSHSSDIEFEDV